MKKIFLTSISFLSLTFFKNGLYVATDIREYAFYVAPSRLDRIAIEWQKEIEAKFANIDQLYKKYQADAPLLPEDMKQRREDEIINAEKEAKDLQKKRFGNDGDLYKKREELMKPIQDRVFNAIEEFSRSKNYAFVFDKSGALTIIYADPKNDISNDIMDKLGITPTN